MSVRENDWFLYSGETAGGFTKGRIYKFLGGQWIESNDPQHYSEAMTDLLELYGGGIDIPEARNFVDNLSTNNLTIQNYSGLFAPVEGDLKQVSTAGGIRFYKYISDAWAEVGGFNGDNIQFKGGTTSIVLGYDSMPTSSTAIDCVIIGNAAAAQKSAGNRDVYIGPRAGGGGIVTPNNEGSDNIGIGFEALKDNTTGQYNVGVGAQALRLIVGGKYNIAIGYQAAAFASNVDYNIAVGYRAMGSDILSGNDNTVIGTEAGGKMTSANNCVYIGRKAGVGLTAGTGIGNVGIGANALFSANSLSRNVAIGYLALWDVTGASLGDPNVAVGSEAGNVNIFGDPMTAMGGSVFIGGWAKSGSGSNIVNNEIVIGFNARGYGGNTAHIGNGSVSSISFGPGTGTAFTNRSDPRLKEDIEDANLSICYSSIKSLPLKRYKYKDFVCQNPRDVHVTGFLSTDVKKVFPKAVEAKDLSFPVLDANNKPIKKTVKRVGPDKIEREFEIEETFTVKDCESVTLSELVPQLVGAVQHLMATVETQQKTIEELQASLSN